MVAGDLPGPGEQPGLVVGQDAGPGAAIAQRLVVGDGAVGKHIANIFAKLDLPPSESNNRRVRAVLAYLNR